MDESFQLRAKRMLGPRQPAALDYEVLSAALSAQQAKTPAARAQHLFDRAAAADAEPELLAETLLGSAAGQEAGGAQRGCFNRAEVKRRRNSP